ncbi:MAG: VWA domain-containing protein, partial [Dehalococcoidia bacterium]
AQAEPQPAADTERVPEPAATPEAGPEATAEPAPEAAATPEAASEATPQPNGTAEESNGRARSGESASEDRAPV